MIPIRRPATVSVAFAVALSVMAMASSPSDAAAKAPVSQPASAPEMDELTRRLITGTPRPDATTSQPASAPEDDKLTKRLISGETGLDLPGRIRQGMASATERLAARDTGDRTQALQRQAVADLDAMIKEAEQKKQQKKNGSASSSAGKGGEKGCASAAESAAGRSGSRAGAQAATAETDAAGEPRSTRMSSIRHELARAWGDLPQRERDELMQGSNEESLPKYREWIDRYYRTLAETARPSASTQPAGGGP